VTSGPKAKFRVIWPFLVNYDKNFAQLLRLIQGELDWLRDTTLVPTNVYLRHLTQRGFDVLLVGDHDCCV
jgi:hypothetical protein